MQTKNIDTKSKLAILAMSLLVLGPQAISPAMSGLIQHFSDLPTSIVRLAISLPLITLVIFTLLTGTLEKKFDKKMIALTGIAIYGAAGIISVFSVSFAMLAVCRLVLGVGLGLFTSYGVAFLSMLFDGDERRKLIGYQSTACNVGSLILTALAGILASVSWNTTFFIYAAAIPVFVMVLLFVPSFPPQDMPEGKHGEKVGMTPALWKVTAGNILFFLVFFLVFSDYSVMIMTSGLGDAAQGSIGLNLLSASALVISLFYKQVSQALKQFTAPAGVAFTCAGFAVAGTAGSLFMASFGAFIIGLGFGIIMPHCYASAAMSSDGPHQPLAAASQTFGTNIASFCSSYVLNLILMIIGKDVAENQIFIGAACVLGVYLIALLVMCFTKKENA